MPSNIDVEALKSRVLFFQRDLWGNEFAHLISTITVRWGSIEHLLYLILKAIDAKRSNYWADRLFRSPALAEQKRRVRMEVKTAVETSYPEYMVHLDVQLDRLQSIQDRRNPIAHGLWLEGSSDRSFKIQPLRIDRTTNNIEQPIEIDLDHLTKLITDMEFLDQGLASLCAEMLAHQQLRKWGRR